MGQVYPVYLKVYLMPGNHIRGFRALETMKNSHEQVLTTREPTSTPRQMNMELHLSFAKLGWKNSYKCNTLGSNPKP